jgi:arginyl-tRNA--protein-N-Asp/Glu arginylyltransferase
MKTRSPSSPVVLTDSCLCPYFEDGRISTIECVIPDTGSIRNYHEFLARGYRRTGHIFYHNICRDCSDCIPMRLETERFVLSASQKRTLRNNRDVRVSVRSRPSLTFQKMALYEKYVRSKHAAGKDGVPEDPLPVLIALYAGYDRIIEMEYYIAKTLIAVGIVDEGEDSLSSNYYYYDTDHLDRRPGVFSILQEISLARSMGKRYYYLGFYIEKNRKMSYKRYFRPNQIYKNGKWTGFLHR